MKIDNFARGNFCVLGHSSDVDREFWVVTNGDFNQTWSNRASAAIAPRGREYAANFCCQPLEHLLSCTARFGDGDRIEENSDTGIGRRELNDAWDGRTLKSSKCAEDFVQRSFGRVFESLAHSHDQRAISERNDFHQLILSCRGEAKHLRFKSRRHRIENEHRFFALLRMTILQASVTALTPRASLRSRY